MKTAEEKAREHAGISTDVEDISWMQFSSRTRVVAYEKYKSFLAGYEEAKRWRDPEEELPPILPNLNYSAPVLAKIKDSTDLQVMCLLLVPDGDDEDDSEYSYSYSWGNCYGNINGDPYWDDEYDVISWRPID